MSGPTKRRTSTVPANRKKVGIRVMAIRLGKGRWAWNYSVVYEKHKQGR
jgi:hypothetical protein